MGPLLLGDQPLPHSRDNEAAFISCLLQAPIYCEYWLSALKEEDFYVPDYRRVFRCMKALIETHPDPDIIALSAYLDERDMLEDLGGNEKLRIMVNVAPSCANLDYYAQAIQMFGRSRGIIGVASEVAGNAFEATLEEIPSVIEKAERSILEVSNRSTVSQVKTTPQAIAGALALMRGMIARDVAAIGYPTMIRELDEIITGVKPGEMIVLGARPSVGKTAMATGLVKSWGIGGYPVYFGSLEMKAELLVMRLMSGQSGIDVNKFMSGGIPADVFEYELTEAARKIENMPVNWDDCSSQWPDIKRNIREDVVKNGAKIGVIDYLQLMKMPGQFHSRENEVATMSGEVKALAMELGIPLIILAQLNRSAEDRPPRLADLRESGAIEQDADGVWLLHRPRPTNDEETSRLIAEGKPLPAKLIVEKNRNGPTGIVDLVFYPQYTRFESPNRVEDNEVPI